MNMHIAFALTTEQPYKAFVLIVYSNLDAVSRICFEIWSLSPRRTHSQRLSIFPVHLLLHTTYRLLPENWLKDEA